MCSVPSDLSDRLHHGGLKISSMSIQDVFTIGPEFQVNTFTSGVQSVPSIAALDGGGYVVAWHSFGQDGFGGGIFGQRYGADGLALGPEFQINNYTNDDQVAPSVAALDDGGFVVIWQSVLQDGFAQGIYGQRYGSDGLVHCPS